MVRIYFIVYGIYIVLVLIIFYYYKEKPGYSYYENIYIFFFKNNFERYNEYSGRQRTILAVCGTFVSRHSLWCEAMSYAIFEVFNNIRRREIINRIKYYCVLVVKRDPC